MFLTLTGKETIYKLNERGALTILPLLQKDGREGQQHRINPSQTSVEGERNTEI